ncbi:MAG: PAS domain-containing protein [Bacteroidota bacterium]
MDTMRDYDIAANRFYGSLGLVSLPLTSWDFYAENLQKLSLLSEDLVLLTALARKNGWVSLPEFHKKLVRDKYVIVVTDVNLEIVHATHNVLEMTGYFPREIIGENPKMFQGKDTSKRSSEKIGKAVRSQQPFEAVVLNYKKDGSPYKCQIKGLPVYDHSGEVVNFIAYERKVA